MNTYKKYLSATSMLDINNNKIQDLIDTRLWRQLSDYQAIESIYNFVRDEIPFGYNKDDNLKASQVLSDGYGQCNTKGTLLMALLRALNIPCRIHGFRINNDLQKGAIPFYIFPLAPQRIIHSWIEIKYKNRWLNLEGYIIDKGYLSRIQKHFLKTQGSFNGYGIATTCLKQPPINWHGQSTYIQKEGIVDDYGTYDHPDDFYQEKGCNLKGIKKYLFRYIFRHLMNINVNRIRSVGIN